MRTGRHLNKIQIIEPQGQPIITETTTGGFVVAGKGAQFTNSKEIIPTVTEVDGKKKIGLAVSEGNAAAVGFLPETTVSFGPLGAVTAVGTDAFGKPIFAHADGTVKTFKPRSFETNSVTTHKEPATVTVPSPSPPPPTPGR
jgi:hypothetical protein